LIKVMVGVAIALVIAMVYLVVVDARTRRTQALSWWNARVRSAVDDHRAAIERSVKSGQLVARSVAGFPTARYLVEGRSGPPYPFPVREGPARHLRDIVAPLLTDSGYVAVEFVDGAGREVAVIADGNLVDRPDGPVETSGVAPMLSAGASVRSGPGEPTRVVFQWPIASGDSRDVPVGLIRLLADPTVVFDPALSGGRRDDSPMELYLVDPGLGHPVVISPSADSRPVDRRRLEAAMASPAVAMGDAAEVSGSGWVVLAAARPVEGSPWLVVGLADRHALLAQDRRRLLVQLAMLLVALCGVIGVAGVRLSSRRSDLQRALDESESRLGIVLSHVDLGLMFVDPDGVVRRANAAAGEVFDVDADALFGRSLWELIPIDRNRSLEQDLSRHSSRSGIVFEAEGRRSDGSSLPLELAVRHVDIGHERMRLLVVRDISDRRRRDAELRRNLEFIDTVLENLPHAVTVTQIDTGELLYVNPRFEEVFGWPRHAFSNLGDGFKSLIPDPRLRHEIATRIRSDILAGGRACLVWDHIEIVAADGSRRTIASVGIPLRDQNLAIAVSQDVTDQYRARRQLAQQERLAAVGRLAAGIAHDFNNMLQVVMMHTELALPSAAGDARLTGHLTTTVGQVVRAAEMIRRILDFARETSVEPKMLDLGKRVSDDLKLLEALISDRVRIETRVAPGQLFVAGDPTQLQQVLTNLVVNASDAMPDGGVIEVELDRLVIEPGEPAPVVDMAPGRWVSLQVRDSGIGIPRDVLGRIFDPFFTTKERGSGTGLGLAQVYGIVRQHGGWIGVESASGQGSVFTVFLPVAMADAADDPPASSIPTIPRGNGRKVLVVEDDPAILHVARDGLVDLGYTVVTASHGRDGLALLEHETDIDLVLSDIVMPEMDGVAMIRELRRLGSSIPVVFMTGYAPELDSEERVALGVSHILNKPFSISDLGRTVGVALEPSGSQSQA
jgi:PAS domain S-box-containing protein